MKEVESFAAQGDVLFRKVAEVPESHEVRAPEDGEHHVVAHSETGHHHLVEAGHGDFFADPDDPLGMVCYLRLESDADVIHARSYDTHETLRLRKGIWEIRRQREHTPEGWRQVED